MVWKFNLQTKYPVKNFHYCGDCIWLELIKFLKKQKQGDFGSNWAFIFVEGGSDTDLLCHAKPYQNSDIHKKYTSIKTN